MVSDDYADEASIRERLRKIDEELEMLRGDLERSPDPMDFGDSGIEFTRLEEGGRMVEALENEKRRLLKLLGE